MLLVPIQNGRPRAGRGIYPSETFCVDKSCLIVEMLSSELQTPDPDSSSQNPEFIRENVDLQTNY
jgi:hypothetical protein